jgi:hypothetical protein
MAVNGSEKPVGHVYCISGQLVLKPFVGFEHLFPGDATRHSSPVSCSSPPKPQEAVSPASPIECVFVPERPRKRSRAKRDEIERSRSPGMRRPHDLKTSNTFDVGDLDGIKLFYRTRLREIGLKALRQIVTEWVKIVEPNRLRSYGAYHKKIPSKGPPGRTPPWWPKEVPYEEPAHLPVSCTRPFPHVEIRPY